MSENKVYLFSLNISLISATRLAGEGRMKELLGVEKIPATMRPLLAQEVIDRKQLNPLAAIKGRARDTLLKFGTRDPLLGWVVDPERVDELMEKIRRLDREFREEKRKLLAGYPDACRAHLDALREACIEEDIENCDAFIEVVRKAQPSLDYLERQLQFRYLEPRAIEIPDKDFRMVSDSLFGQAIGDVVARAKAAIRCKGVLPKTRALVEIRDKLHGLGYLDTRFQGFGAQIDDLLSTLPLQLPEKEWPTTANFALQGALDVMADEGRLLERIEDDAPMFASSWESADAQTETVSHQPAEVGSDAASAPTVVSEPDISAKSETENAEETETQDLGVFDFDLPFASAW